MQNLTSIPILPGLNDVPEILEDGPNGALVTQVVNQLVNKSFRPFNTLDDNTNAIERYVDTVNGLDTNTGLTPESPVKTIDLKKAAHTPQLAAIGISSPPTARSAI